MLKYLKDHIVEEIDGAIDYLMKAIEHKGTVLGEKFRTMSDMEVEHANCLTKMFNSMKKPSTVTDAEYAAMQKEVIDKYTTSMSKIEMLKKLYKGE